MACGCQIQQMSNVTAYVMLFRKDPEHDWAMLAYVLAETSQARQETSYAEFSTTYGDDTVIDTSNSSELPGFDAGPRKHQSWLPRVKNLARLYQIHREVIRRHGSGASPRQIRDTQALSVVAEAMQKDFREQETRGWFHLDPAAIEYRPTLKGAYLMTWRQLWPISAIRKIQRDLLARRLDASVHR